MRPRSSGVAGLTAAKQPGGDGLAGLEGQVLDAHGGTFALAQRQAAHLQRPDRAAAHPPRVARIRAVDFLADFG